MSEDQKEKNEKKKGDKNKNILTYGVIMIISVIIIILFAAMADNRENELDTKINETQRANETIQNEVVNLKDENYNLNKKIEEDEAKISANEAVINNYKQMTEVWNLMEEGKDEEAISKLKNMDKSNFDETANAYYSALCEILNID